MTPPYEAPEGMDKPDAEEGDADYELAGQTILDAIKGGDAKGLADALCHLTDIHMAGGHEEPDGDEEGLDEEEEAGGKKPNLALLLMGHKRK